MRSTCCVMHITYTLCVCFEINASLWRLKFIVDRKDDMG